MFADSYIADAEQFDAFTVVEPRVYSLEEWRALPAEQRHALCEHKTVTLGGSKGFTCLNCGMTHENFYRLEQERKGTVERELQPGECGGKSCPPEYGDGVREAFGSLGPRAGNGSGFGFDAGGGRHVIKSTKSYS